MAGNTYNYLIFYNSILLLGFCAYFLQREVSALTSQTSIEVLEQVEDNK